MCVQLSAAAVQADVPIFNSMIAACAHGGGFARARDLFDAMPAQGCQPDAVTFANLIRAYKKGGQW
jgi:pentatricopeptide repeat domain-containing protein 1